MIRLFFLLALVLSSLSTFSQSKAKAILKATEGRQEFLKQNYWGALTLFRDALTSDPESALINYRIGETQYALKHYDIAIEYLEKAEKLDREVDLDLPLMMGYANHRMGRVDIAKEYYRLYRDVVTDGRGRLVNISGLINQCEYAKEMMAKPIDVEIKNLSKEINSRFDDYAPSVTADGKTLVFTSRRPSTSNDVDELGDYKYFEDIYITEWNEEELKWEPAELFSENINSPSHDAVLSINGAGNHIYVYKNDQGNAGDIFESRLTGNWSVPKKLKRPINSSYFESSVSITSDGNTMYFISERPGGLGRGDVYMSHKLGEDLWSKPENLGDVINTPFDEKFVFVHPNGSTLFFASIGHLTMGSYDIFRSEFTDGIWSEPVNLGYPINTVNEESTFSMTADNKKLLISAEYGDGVGERDIYEVNLSSTDILHSLNIDSEVLKRKRNITLFGKATTDRGEKPIPFAEVSIRDAKTNVELFKGKTDRRGAYEASVPRGGNYIVQIKSTSGETQEEKANLKVMEDYEREWQLDVAF